jgi:hypothetical protein
MEIRPVDGQRTPSLSQAAPRPKPQAEAAALADCVEISDTAREASKIAAWADVVRAMSDVRGDALARATALLENGALFTESACRGAAAAMLASM